MKKWEDEDENDEKSTREQKNLMQLCVIFYQNLPYIIFSYIHKNEIMVKRKI
jgi:hypothetical protein